MDFNKLFLICLDQEIGIEFFQEKCGFPHNDPLLVKYTLRFSYRKKVIEYIEFSMERLMAVIESRIMEIVFNLKYSEDY